MDPGEGDEPGGHEADKIEESFDMPWKVATIPEVRLRAYLRENDGTPEWIWARIHAFLEIKTDAFKFLKTNLEGLGEFLQEVQVDPGEVRYNIGKVIQPGRQWKDHSLESRALFGFCCWTLRNKPLKEHVKTKAFSLMQTLAELSVQKGLDLGSINIHGMIIDRSGSLQYENLQLVQSKAVKNLEKLLAHCPGANTLWRKLRGEIWHGQSMSTATDHASVKDLMFFLAYLQAHPTLHMGQQNLYLCFAKLMLPTLINQLGFWLDGIATDLTNESLQKLPTLKSKYGNVSKAMGPVNRMLLLNKIKAEKIHRRRVGKSHSDLQPAESTWARHEHYLDTVLHSRALQSFPKEPLQLSISWDPGNYTGRQVCAGVAYSPTANQACYLLSQTLGKLMMTNVDDSLIQKAKERKLTRVAGFNELRGLDAMMVHSLGVSIKDFAVPKGLCLKPLTPTQVRLRAKDGRVYIIDTKTGEGQVEVPPTINLSKLSMLISISDQGPLNVTSLNYVMFGPQALLCLCLWDPYHRAWSDIKGSAKRSSYGAYKCILELVCLFNTNYGPWNSSQWYFKKRDALEEFLACTTTESPAWVQYEELICLERKIQQPTDEDDRMKLLSSMANLQNFVTKGPLVKLMRWFSFFECCAHWENDFYGTKMVLEAAQVAEGALQDEGQDNESDQQEIGEGKAKDEKEQLAALKKRVGTYKLAPRLITPKNMAIKEVLNSVCRSTWKSFAHRARAIKSPEEVMAMNISCVGEAAWKEELVHMVQCSASREDTIQHLLPEWSHHDKTLGWQSEYLEHLLQARAQSLSTTYCLPPLRYCHVLSCQKEQSKAAQTLAIKEFHALLKAECAAKQCVVGPLKHMAWTHNPVCRVVLVAHEEDGHSGSQHAKALHQVTTKTLGDSRIIENIHQHGRDLERTVKNDFCGDTRLFANMLRSGCLEERHVPLIAATNAEKVQEGAGFMREPIARKLNTKGHKLSGNLQHMMLPKTKQETWPSPSPASLFQGVCATEWCMKFFGQPTGEEYKCGINAAWLSVMAKKGWMLAHRTTSMVIKVVASCEFAFLGWQAEATPVPLSKEIAFTLVEERRALNFHRILDLDEWLVIPTEPQLLTPVRGPMGWMKCGEPLPLQAQMCLEGCTLLTNQQLVKLVKHLGGVPPRPAKRRCLQELIIKMCLGEELQAVALSMLKESENKKDTDEIDSQFSEILSELGKEDGHQQDLQELQKKKKP